ncbi:DUF732 domain-containing protein [Mycobacterium sp. Aquia_216]|uniref:DUF732 domain-containing protein n=1 Tax=Mycobacterium sp. Aquia_216 TaxID=2991729 RepID=UPI00227C4A9C|nr:DUF732 domain-containing protein [Mycobacterium sp. Aquia_216]WAJ42629.1 DUF732 domain-containing protein [Mycobacterium sp. Aquia_216]
MKALPFLAGVAVLIGLAAPAHADSDDDAFLAALTKAGISYQNPDKAIKAGQKVCDLANSGTSQLDIVRDIRDLNPAFTMASAARFAQAAASVYCPNLLADNPDPGSGT